MCVWFVCVFYTRGEERRVSLLIRPLHTEFTLCFGSNTLCRLATQSGPRSKRGRVRQREAVLFRRTMPLFKLHWSGMLDFTGRCPPLGVNQRASAAGPPFLSLLGSPYLSRRPIAFSVHSTVASLSCRRWEAAKISRAVEFAQCTRLTEES